MEELTHAAQRQTSVIRDMRAELEARDVQLASLQAHVSAVTPLRLWAADAPTDTIPAVRALPMTSAQPAATPRTVLLPPSPPQQPSPSTPGGVVAMWTHPESSEDDSDQDGAAARALVQSSRAALLLSSVLDSPPQNAPPNRPEEQGCFTTSALSPGGGCPGIQHASPLLHPSVTARLKALCLEADALREERDRFARLWAGAAAAQQAWQARCLAAEDAADELRQAELLLTRRVGELEAGLRDRECQVEELRGWLGGPSVQQHARAEQPSVVAVLGAPGCAGGGLGPVEEAGTEQAIGAVAAPQESVPSLQVGCGCLETVLNTLSLHTPPHTLHTQEQNETLRATIAALHARLSDAATLGLALQHTLGSEGARLRDLEARLAEEHAARTEACGMLEEVRSTEDALKEGDACCCSVSCVLFACLLSNNRPTTPA